MARSSRPESSSSGPSSPFENVPLTYQPSRRDSDPYVSNDSESEDPNQKRRRPYPVWRRRLESSFWLTLSLSTLYFTELPWLVYQLDPRIHLPAFFTGLALFFAFFSVFVYLNYYLPYMLRTKVHYKKWHRHAPKAIPLASVLGVLSSMAMMVAFWRIFGGWTFPLFFVWTMGLLVILSWC